MTDAETSEILEELHAASRETALGFCACAAEARGEHLRLWLMDRAERSARAARALRDVLERLALERLGRDVPDTARARCSDIVPQLRKDDDMAMLAACERAEDATIVRYRDALECSLPSAVRDVVARQFARLLDNRGVIHEVHGSLKRPPQRVSAPAAKSPM